MAKVKGQFGPEDMCVYRSPDGKKCAIGCLIPDSEYKPEFEGKSAEALLSDYSVPSLQGLDQAFIAVLQTIHDLHYPWDWAKMLDRFETDWAELLA